MARIKEILNSPFILSILIKINAGYRPTLISKQLKTTPQALHKYTSRLEDADLIVKEKDINLSWKLTEKGAIILKEHLRRRVNSFNSKVIPIRLENVSVAFKIHSEIRDNEKLQWTYMKNRVAKCAIKKNDHTIELIKSEKGSSIMLVHLYKRYKNWTDKLFSLAYLSQYYAKQAATQFRLQISQYGSLVRRPHIAFESDLIAYYLTASHTAEIKTKQSEGEGQEESKAWIDSSDGAGELETNDDEYGYDYLMMPKTVKEVANMTVAIVKQTKGYERCYHPLFTVNN